MEKQNKNKQKNFDSFFLQHPKKKMSCFYLSIYIDGRINGVEIIRWLLYADDLLLFCRNVAEAGKILQILHNTCFRFGLNISFLKTKTQVFNNEELSNLTSLFPIGDNVIENVSEFTYLGQTFSNKE